MAMSNNTDEPVEGNLANEPSTEEIEAKIIHQLKIYPIISPTMLQGALGPSLKPSLWRPVLMGLIERGIVREEQETLLTPAERYNNYIKLSLTDD